MLLAHVMHARVPSVVQWFVMHRCVIVLQQHRGSLNLVAQAGTRADAWVLAADTHATRERS